MMWETSLQGVQIQIPQNSRDTSLLPLERDHGVSPPLSRTALRVFLLWKVISWLEKENAEEDKSEERQGQGMTWGSGNIYSWPWILDFDQPWLRPTSSLTSEPRIPHKSLKVNRSFQQTWCLKPPWGFYPPRTQAQQAEFMFKFISLSSTH